MRWPTTHLGHMIIHPNFTSNQETQNIITTKEATTKATPTPQPVRGIKTTKEWPPTMRTDNPTKPCSKHLIKTAQPSGKLFKTKIILISGRTIKSASQFSPMLSWKIAISSKISSSTGFRNYRIASIKWWGRKKSKKMSGAMLEPLSSITRNTKIFCRMNISQNMWPLPQLELNNKILIELPKKCT